MSTFRVHISFPMDTALPRDEMQITPHYGGDNAQALANALKANLIANTQVGTKPFKIKVYDALKAPPSFPLATAEQTGTPPITSAPRELALCLSYYSTYNRPTYRGRLYIPHALIGLATGSRPSSQQRDNCGIWATTLGKNLPATHAWVIYSRKRGTMDGVSNWWVDDEWDVVRKRGLRSTTRTVGTIP